MSAKIGYMRVSTNRQVNDRQEDALTAYGVDRLFADKITGAKFERAGLAAALDYARPGDSLVVASLDRLGRSLSQVIRVADDLEKRGIVLISIKENIDYSTTTGKLIAGIFGALAQHERALINERAAEARAAAHARGRRTGRPKALTDDQARQLRALHAGGESVADLCRSFKVSRATVYRALSDPAAQPAA